MQKVSREQVPLWIQMPVKTPVQNVANKQGSPVFPNPPTSGQNQGVGMQERKYQMVKQLMNLMVNQLMNLNM